MRPHVKAHKCTGIAREQLARGHTNFTCATPSEVVDMARAGMGADLLLANETVDPVRLRAMADCDARVTVAVDSDATIAAAAANGITEVLIDVNVGMPRCGVAPDAAGALADTARAAGLEVRGINKVLEGRPHCVDAMDDRQIQLVINTTEGRQAIEDSVSLRRAALMNGIAYQTTLRGARAALEAIAVAKRGDLRVAPLQKYAER